MINKIGNEAQYNQVIALIENFIERATIGGGFSSLSKTEADELGSLSLLAEQYEDNLNTPV
jgi:HTH-type transcriptional regulator/antitoxin HigA